MLIMFGGATVTTYVVSVVDPTGPSVNGAALGLMTGGLHNILTGRNGQPINPPQLAAARVEPGMLPQSRKSQVWVSGFGSHRERDDDGQVLAYDHNYYGGVGGYETAFDRRSRIGFMLGYAFSEVSTDVRSLYTGTDSFFADVYGRVRFGGLNLDASLMGGYEQNDNERLVADNLNGFEVAAADFDSYFLSPSFTLSSEFKVSGHIALRPSATGSYSVAWYNGYSESDTTRSNLTIDDRMAHALIGKLQMDAVYVFNNGNEVGLMAGGRYRYTMNGDINATLAGISFRYPASGDDTHFEALVGANARVAAKDNLNLTVDIEYALSDGIETSLSGQLGLEFTF